MGEWGQYPIPATHPADIDWDMDKNVSNMVRRSSRCSGILVAVLALLMAGSGNAMAHSSYSRHHHSYSNARRDWKPYRHDHNGYWDRYGHYHRFEYRENQRGYWRQENGFRFWITIR